MTMPKAKAKPRARKRLPGKPDQRCRINAIRAVSSSVGLYEKLELRIDLDAEFRNPFDPEEIDLQATFTSPSGKKWKIWGFYNPSSWNALWMVRFSPTETGRWQYGVTVTTPAGTAKSAPAEFVVNASAHHGFVGVAPNQRYLMHSDKTPFYGVGLWYNDNCELYNQGDITEANLDNLKKRGANFISFYHTTLETMGSGLGRYDENRCGRMDQLFDWCEQRNMKISWNLLFHSHISQAVWGMARYRHNPYRLISSAKDFFGSAEVWEFQQKLFRYIIARWGYSRALFLWFVVDEINGTEGWRDGGRAVAEQWCRKAHAFFKKHDPYHRPTTGTLSGGLSEWWPKGYRIFDIAAREIYEAQGHPMPTHGKLAPGEENPLRLSYRNYAKQVQDLWHGFRKPAIIGECGWDHTYYEPGTPGYLAMCHNALWVSLANGLCATPFWWRHENKINDCVVNNQMLSFAQFVADIDFANLRLEPAEITAGACDAWAMKSDQLVFGWVVNPGDGVANESFTVTGLRNGAYEVRLYKTWQGRYLDPQTILARNGRLTCTIPELRTTEGHASNMGEDVAFRIVPKKAYD